MSDSTERSATDIDDMTAADFLADLPPRLHNIYEPFVRLQPDRPAFLEGGRTWTYKAFSAAVDAVAADLTRLGVRGGDRVMIVSENSVVAGAVVFAASKLDAWAIVANPRLSPRELDQIYEHSGARRRLFAAGISSEAAEHGARTKSEIGSLGPFPQIAIEALNEDAKPEPVQADNASQVAVLIYTSGTTGAPKGVMLSHRNLMFAAMVTGTLRNYGPTDCAYIVGRAKEMIIRSGFNVYPAEIEAVINEHKAVLQSAVVGRQVESNEEVVAFVQLVPGVSLTPDELKAYIDPLLTAYKRPSEIIILDAFPAGSTGKILKHILKAQANA